MKNLKKIVFEKQAASAYIDAAVLIILLSMYFITMIFAYMIWMLQINTSDNINLVLTTYCKKMETQGCLSATEINKMKAELNEFGYINVSVSGTGTDGVKQSYGSDIEINVKGDIDYVNASEKEEIKNVILNFRTFLSDPSFGVIKDIQVSKCGTSKY